MWFGAFPGAFGLGRAQPQRRPSKEHPGMISFRMDWLDLLAVQGSLKSLLQHHSTKASILQRSAFFTVQLSHPYMTTGSEWTGWISLQSKGLPRVFSNTTVQKHQFFGAQPSSQVRPDKGCSHALKLQRSAQPSLCMGPQRRGKLEGPGRVQVGAEFIILIAGSRGPRSPSPSLRGWSESLWMLGVGVAPGGRPEVPSADLCPPGPCSPRDSQESSPTPQYKSINSLVLSLLHSPTLTSIHAQPEGKIGLPRANPRGRLRSPS